MVRTDQKLRTHVRKLVILSSHRSLQQILKLGNTDIFFLRPLTLYLSFQKADLFKHFLIWDWLMTSFCAVSALSMVHFFCFDGNIFNDLMMHDEIWRTRWFWRTEYISFLGLIFLVRTEMLRTESPGVMAPLIKNFQKILQYIFNSFIIAVGQNIR